MKTSAKTAFAIWMISSISGTLLKILHIGNNIFNDTLLFIGIVFFWVSLFMFIKKRKKT
jgi:hypothetical protein